MFLICCLLVPVAGVAGMALRAFSPGSAVQTGADVRSVANSCMGPTLDAGLGCPCSRIGGQCRDPLSICDLTHHCKCDGSKGYLAGSGSVCLAHPNTTTTSSMTCPTTVAPVTCPTTTTVPPTTTATPDRRCGNAFGFRIQTDGAGNPETEGINCVFLDKGESTVLELTSRKVAQMEPVAVRFTNRLVSCSGGSSFQVTILDFSAASPGKVSKYCDDVFLSIYDQMLCGVKAVALTGTQWTIPASFFFVSHFVTDYFVQYSYRISVTCN